MPRRRDSALRAGADRWGARVPTRRRFLSGLLGLCALAGAVDAQEARTVPRIGVLVPGSPTPGSLPMRVFDAFREGLYGLGYVEGRTVVVEARWNGGRPERDAALTRELVQANVDVIVAGTS